MFRADPCSNCRYRGMGCRIVCPKHRSFLKDKRIVAKLVSKPDRNILIRSKHRRWYE